MIKNQKQRQAANSKIRGLEETRDALDPSDKPAWRAYTDLIDDTCAEVTEYDEIAEGVRKSFAIGSLDDVGEALIKARIARGWTQAMCAEQIGVSEQQVQKDEAREFENAGLARCAEILDVLGYELVGHVRPKGFETHMKDDGASLSTESRADINWFALSGATNTAALRSSNTVELLTDLLRIVKGRHGGPTVSDADAD